VIRKKGCRWQQAGVWQRVQEELLHRLRHAERIDFSRASLDSAFVRAKGGAKKRARTPRTAASGGVSTTSSSIGGACPSLSA
jgi:hypothetical protein